MVGKNKEDTQRPKNSTPKLKRKKPGNEVPRNQPRLTAYLKKNEEMKSEDEKPETLAKNRHCSTPNTQVNQLPPTQEQDEKLAKDRSLPLSKVQELSKLFCPQIERKPPPPPPTNHRNEQVPLMTNGRRPSENSTGNRDISCGREPRGDL